MSKEGNGENLKVAAFKVDLLEKFKQDPALVDAADDVIVNFRLRYDDPAKILARRSRSREICGND